MAIVKDTFAGREFKRNRFYHGTPTRNEASILKHGIRGSVPSGRDSEMLYIAHDPQTAFDYALDAACERYEDPPEGITVFEVKLPEEFTVRGDFALEELVVEGNHVPPKYLKVYKRVKL